MLNNKKVVVAGHICVDITPIIPNDGSFSVDALRPGKLFNVGEAKINTGGAVANTGLALDMLGADVMLIGKIGNDELGHMVLKSLDSFRSSADKDMIISPTVSTSYSVVIAPPGMDRIFLHNPGANDTFCTSDLDYSRIRDAALFHFGYPPIMAHMYKNNGEELVRMFQDVKTLGVATSLDMAGIDPDTDAGRADWNFILKSVLPYVDFFLPSAEELCYMIDKKRYEEWQVRANGGDVCDILDIYDDVAPLADMLVEHYHAKVVVVKCGSKGLYYKTAGYNDLSDIGANASINLSAWSEKSGWVKAYEPEAIVSATGAGDVAIAAFLMGVLEGMSIKNCVRLAAAEGACCLEGIDALSTLRTIPELQQAFLMGI